MSGLMDKVKDKVTKSGGSGDKPSGVEGYADKGVNQGIDQATDRVGMGDKYDDKIDKFADKEVNKQIPGGQQ